MRKFLLQNEYGEQKELQFGNIFFHAPSGLGYGYATEYRNVDDFFLPTNTENEQMLISGTLVFFPPYAYKNYQSLFDWILASKKLELAYKPDNTWYYQQISIDRVEKTELTIAGVLEVPVEIMPLSPIYLPYELDIELSGDVSTDLKKYDYEYDYQYGNSSVGGEVEFSFDAQIDSGLEIIINGSVSAPVMTFFADGEQIGKIDLSSASASVGEYIRYSSIPTSAGVYKYASGTETEITSQIGLNASYPTFFMLPPHKTIKAVLSATSLTGVTASIKVYEYFRTV